MASLPAIMPLDGADGYLRWKESVLLRVHTLDVAYVLSEARPAGPKAVAKKWARDDAVCRGHILAALSDRLLSTYACFATAAELWRALARTYDVENEMVLNTIYQSSFSRSTAGVFLEQLAYAKALGVAAGLSDKDLAKILRGKIPSAFRGTLTPGEEFESIWEAARRFAATGLNPWHMDKAEQNTAMDKAEQNTASTSRKRGRRRA